ncbi:MAG: tetratricopeptide repeat protein [Deltaproteobacteria bacterium]|nr:tetratricopeptide repeat protein [Deltaproteobacteria bacterium]
MSRRRHLPFLVLLLAPLMSAALCGDTAPKNPQLLIQQQACIANYEKQDYDAAETRCELCLEYDERDAECLNGLGLIWYARGDDDRARKYYIRAIRENNDFGQARSNMGVLEFENGNFLEASKFFLSAIEIDPRNGPGRYNLALSYLRLGQIEVAKAKDPTQPVPTAEKWYKEAETQYRRIFELFPNNAQAYSDMGTIMSYRAQYTAKTGDLARKYTEDAEQYYVRCLDIDASRKDCQGNLAHLYLAIGRFDEALFHFIQCLAVDKGDPICGNEIKAAYAGSQLKSEALKKYMDQLVQNPGYGPGHYGFCLALFDKGMVEMAVTECENSLKLDNTICLAHYQLAKHYKSVLDKDLALENCRGLIRCAGETKHQSEVGECKTIVQALEVQ